MLQGVEEVSTSHWEGWEEWLGAQVLIPRVQVLLTDHSEPQFPNW